MKTLNTTTPTALATPAETARIEAFLGDLARRGRAKKTINSYRSDWSGVCEWYASARGESMDIVDVDAEVVLQFRGHLSAEGMRPATVNRKLVFVKRYMAWASARGDVGFEQVEAVRSVKPVAQGPRKPRGLSDIELRRFLKEVERRAGPRDQAIVYTLLETGLRVSELVAMDMEQLVVNGRRAMVHVEDERNAGLRSRRLALGPNARRALRRYLAMRGEHPGAVFIGERGPLTANAVQRIVRKYCAFAKVKASPGTLRHTFATSFLAEEGDLVALADLLGHESLETTRLYLQGNRDAAPPAGSKPSRPRVLIGGAHGGS